MIARQVSAFPVAFMVVLGSSLLAVALGSGAAARTAPGLTTPAVMLTVGDRAKPLELIHLLRDLASYETMVAARYVAQADAARLRGEAPVVRIPMPSTAAAEALARLAPSAGATATVEPAPPER
jgi:hypothetical protein